MCNVNGGFMGLKKWWFNGILGLFHGIFNGGLIGSNGNLNGIWSVVDLYPSEKYDESSVGMMKFPTEWKNNPNVPNHQPA
jgi:hypothetical protein